MEFGCPMDVFSVIDKICSYLFDLLTFSSLVAVRKFYAEMPKKVSIEFDQEWS